RRTEESAVGPEPTSGPGSSEACGAAVLKASAASGTPVGGAALPSSSMVISGLSTSTVSPSAACSSVTTPANGQGSSTSDFAVSISTNTWLTSTVSPTLTFHEAISASVRPSPTSGRLKTVISTPWLPRQYAKDRSRASSNLSISGRYWDSTLEIG